jgi:uncharacterized protein YuzE
MKATYDPEADALCLRFVDARIVESAEISKGVVLDFDADHRIVAIEVLEASKLLSASAKLD